MKKLMIAAAIAGAVGMAQADFSPLEGFESPTWAQGAKVATTPVGGYRYWNASANDTNEQYEVIETVVTNYAETGETPLTDAGLNYLALTGVELLERYVLPQDEETETAYDLATSDLYIDTLVKFTVTEDDAPTPAAGDKLCIWVGVVSNETTGVITTNLMVTAGYVYDDEGNINVRNYATTTTFGDGSDDIDINAWHRLTVKSIAGIDRESVLDGFIVYIDGAPVSADSTTIIAAFLDDEISPLKSNWTAAFAANQLFPSIVEHANGGTITSVGFKGSGAIDNLQFTNTDPNPQQTGPTVDGSEPADGTAFVAAATSGTTNILPQDWTLDGNAIKDGNGDTYATIPSFYTAALNNGTLTLTLNTTALPTIGEATVESETKEAIEVGAATFTATLTTTSTKLYYGLKVATSLDANATWTLATLTQGTGEAMQISADKPSDGNGGYAAAGFYKVYVTDIAPVTP